MAELTFVGAAGTVTGSKHLVTIGEKHLFVDCGLFQGPHEVEALNEAPLPVPATKLDAIVITHGHLDHVGYLPKIVRDGFRGPIYCTAATADVMEIVLEDAAHLQKHAHERGFHRERSHRVAPFFDDDDVATALRQVHTVPLETDFDVCGATVRYHYAGHIIGAGFVDMRVDGKRTVFSGDLGRYNSALLFDPGPLEACDNVVCESTYGDREHPPDSLGQLQKTLLDGVARGGPIVIPTFAVERAQDLMYAIGRLQQSDPQIANLPVHLDSPMAIKVDGVFARHRDAFRPIPESPGAPFGCRNLTLHVTRQDSQQLNDLAGPAIILASSGMATGGRVLYHLHRHLSNPHATIAFPGYQVQGTLGRMLCDGKSPVRIAGDQLTVRAAIVHLSGFSAHADQNELLRWLQAQRSTKSHVYLVHGEPASAYALAGALTDRSITASVARRGETVTL
ncbi:MAG TPA: MBL fold metallo-hydrolase [Candidatus Cybelea sp.]|jgi:metallo-beta-lactamase family protein|nr:MBL fold metallo-hydrolase [Candidatus Cybelea sp.]